MQKLLPILMILITGKPRYRVVAGVDFEWSDGSWTHNVFRVWEMVFYRRYGIRAEMATFYENGTIRTVCYSWESVFVYLETKIRSIFRWRLPFKVYIPILKTPQGIPFFASPYLFAIATDTTSSGGSAGSGTLTLPGFTCTGSNGLLAVSVYRAASTDDISGVTYHSVSTTRLATRTAFSTNGITLYYLFGPDTGSSYSTVISGSGGFVAGCQASYTGVSNAGTDSSNTGSTASGSGLTVATTVVASNCWLIGAFGNTSSSEPTAGTGTTKRITGTNIAVQIFDSNTTVSTGSQSLIIAGAASKAYGGQIASFAPPAAATNKWLSLMHVGT